ncbi:MAG: nitroreductase family protein [Candidatus Delongbacteria bacterium]|nr:nitroreductase family protein [Candidatus Delongbacteria bacterium]
MRCGLCMRICPEQVFNISDRRGRMVIHQHRCRICGQCIGICPVGSIQHSGFSDGMFQVVTDYKIDPDIVYRFLSNYQSIRSYCREIPSRALMEQIVEIAGFAPENPHRRIDDGKVVRIVYGYQKMAKLTALLIGYYRHLIHDASNSSTHTLSIIKGKLHPLKKILPDITMRLDEFDKGVDLFSYHAPMAVFVYASANLISAPANCHAAGLYIQLYASAYGIGSCWSRLMQMAVSNEFLIDYSGLHEFLKIPQGMNCYSAFTAGYPLIRPSRVPKRKTSIGWIADCSAPVLSPSDSVAGQ